MSFDRTTEERFAMMIEAGIERSLDDDADPAALAAICFGTARELFDRYGPEQGTENFLEFVESDTVVEREVREWLEYLEDEDGDED